MEIATLKDGRGIKREWIIVPGCSCDLCREGRAWLDRRNLRRGIRSMLILCLALIVGGGLVAWVLSWALGIPLTT